MTEETENTSLVNKPNTEENKVDPDTPVKPKHTEVLPKISKPVVISHPAEKEVKPVAIDPKGQFDYSNCIQHKVEPGEALIDIAQKYVVAFQQLRYFNHLSKENPRVREGQIIYIPPKPIYVPYGR